MNQGLVESGRSWAATGLPSTIPEVMETSQPLSSDSDESSGESDSEAVGQGGDPGTTNPPSQGGLAAQVVEILRSLGYVPRTVPTQPVLESEEPALDCGPASEEQVAGLNSDLPSGPPIQVPPTRTPPSSRVLSPVPSVSLDEEDRDFRANPSDLEARRLAILEAQDILGLQKPPEAVPRATGLKDPHVKSRPAPSVTNFCWDQGAVEFVEEMGGWLDGSKPSKQGGKPWEIGDLCLPASLPPPTSSVHRYSYQPADPQVLATKWAEAEKGDKQPFRDHQGVPLELEAPVTLAPKTLQACEAQARLLMGAVNSAVLFHQRIAKVADTLPADLQPALAQLANDLAASVQYGWRNTANWQLLRRQGALDSLGRRYHLTRDELTRLYRAPLTGPCLFGPCPKEGSNILQAVHASMEARMEKAAMASVYAKATQGRSAAAGAPRLQGQKRPAPTQMRPPVSAKVPKSSRQVSVSQGATQVTLTNTGRQTQRSPLEGAYAPNNLSWQTGNKAHKRSKKRSRKGKQGPFKGPRKDQGSS